MAEVLKYGVCCFAFSPDGLDEASTDRVESFLTFVHGKAGNALTDAIEEVVEHGDKVLAITARRELAEDEVSMLRQAAADTDFIGGVEFNFRAEVTG